MQSLHLIVDVMQLKSFTMGDLLIYPHRLFSLDRKQIGQILETTINFTMYYLENNMPELVAEIERLADKPIPQEVKLLAVRAVEDFTDDLHYWLITLLIANDDKWNYRKDRASRHYLKVLNIKYSLWIVPPFEEGNANEGKGAIISIPLFEALGEATTRIFDYTISKSAPMKYKLSKSNDYYRKKILKTFDKRSPKYYFIKVLQEYGATNMQLVKNMDGIFSIDHKSAIKTLNKLPPLYR